MTFSSSSKWSVSTWSEVPRIQMRWRPTTNSSCADGKPSWGGWSIQENRFVMDSGGWFIQPGLTRMCSLRTRLAAPIQFQQKVDWGWIVVNPPGHCPAKANTPRGSSESKRKSLTESLSNSLKNPTFPCSVKKWVVLPIGASVIWRCVSKIRKTNNGSGNPAS